MAQARTDWMRWRPPKLAGDADDDAARATLLEQHVRLRIALDELDRQAIEVVRTGTCSRPTLAAALEATATWLCEHMADEERALERLLPPTDAAAVALARLREDHQRQRGELHAMCRLARASGDAISLALGVRGFVADARLDLDVEDERFLASTS